MAKHPLMDESGQLALAFFSAVAREDHEGIQTLMEGMDRRELVLALTAMNGWLIGTMMMVLSTEDPEILIGHLRNMVIANELGEG